MSIRTEPKEMSPGMQQALSIPQHVMTAAQAEGPLMAPAGAETAMVAAPVNDQHLAQANGAPLAFRAIVEIVGWVSFNSTPLVVRFQHVEPQPPAQAHRGDQHPLVARRPVPEEVARHVEPALERGHEGHLPAEEV